MNFGSALADKVFDDANQSWSDQQLNSAKAKWREMILAINNTTRDRNQLISDIQKMPAGQAKVFAIQKFQEAESGFQTAFNQAKPLLDKLIALSGDTLVPSQSATFGALPLIAWGAIAASSAAVAYVISTMYETRQKYEAIRANPEIAKYLPSSGFFSSLGGGVEKAAIIAAILIGGAYALSIARRKA